MVQQFSEDNSQDIAQFLEKLNEQSNVEASHFVGNMPSLTNPSYDRSFEKLEHKIQELEERFESSAAQNRLILSELAHTRSALNRQKNRDAFLEHISRTIASLKNSVENLSRARQQTSPFYEETLPRTFDAVPTVPSPAEEELQAEREKHQQELAEKERVFSSLRQKASQLKAVNSALDREIKKVQQEKMDALKKSAEQAKEILSLRDQLTAAEERFKSFNFEGRIISIKRQYEQKVSRLETQLKEISNTCMKQVEEIESLKAENLQLQNATKERDELQVRLQAAEKEVAQLKQEIAALQQSSSKEAQDNMVSFQERLREVQSRRDGLARELEQAKTSLANVQEEKAALENNFKQLVAKINSNDEVISNLKHKIEVLSAQNETLANANKTLTNRNDDLVNRNGELENRNNALETQSGELGKQNETLLAANRKLVDRNAELSNENKNLTQANQTLHQHNVGLSQRTDVLAKQAQRLDEDKAKLDQENKRLSQEKESLSHTLRSKEAALEASRLEQQKMKEAASKITLHKSAPQTAKAETTVQKLSEADSMQEQPSEELRAQQPVTPSEQSAQKAQTKPLPEIRIPKPRPPQFEQSEDFLEKTNTFIGRMRWSVFGEDK